MKNNNSNINISFNLLFIAFVLSMIFMILKFCGIISFSWIYVFLPLIITIALDILLILIAIIIFVILNTKRR